MMLHRKRYPTGQKRVPSQVFSGDTKTQANRPVSSKRVGENFTGRWPKSTKSPSIIRATPAA